MILVTVRSTVCCPFIYVQIVSCDCNITASYIVFGAVVNIIVPLTEVYNSLLFFSYETRKPIMMMVSLVSKNSMWLRRKTSEMVTIYS